MKKMKKQKLDALLSQYIDGVLSEQEVQKVESLLAMDTSARQSVEELRRLKELLASQTKLTPNIGFWTRFSMTLEGQKMNEHNLLPFPRKYIPAISIMVTAGLVVFGTLIIQNRMQFIRFFSQKSYAVREAYEKKFLENSLLPLFSKVDKDRTLQFSLFGTLSLDDKSKTALRVDEQSEKGYRIEFGKDLKGQAKTVTFDKFIAEVKPSEKQRKIIDSLLELSGRRIESSILIGENNTMAIAPDLPMLNKVMVTNIASCLEPIQQARFERLLEANNAPYSVTTQRVTTGKNVSTVHNIQQSSQSDRFVIVTPDTMMYSQIHIDLDSLRRKMEEDFVAFVLRRDAMLKRMMSKEFQHAPMPIIPPAQDRIAGNEEIFNVEYNSSDDGNGQQKMRVVIQPRIQRQVLNSETPGRSMQLYIGKDTDADSMTRRP
jgi:hypothetical protein